jgi:hypothetical protein
VFFSENLIKIQESIESAPVFFRTFSCKEIEMTLRTLLLLLTIVCFPILLHAQRDLTTERSLLFSGSGNCTLCHGPGSNANITSAGKDVSPPNLWRSTMMANAARDPFWQAVVASESHDLPALAEVIEDRCTNCHAPMGHEQSRQNGDPAYMLADAEADPLAMDGVSCTLCHQVEEENFGTTASFSGAYEIATRRVTYGPYSDPLLQPMTNVSGFAPVYSPHVERAELCATCHTLFTPFVDDQGNIAGEFPEQTPFIEWKRSVYPGRGQTCQSCHMPAIDEAIRISSLPQSSPARSPYYQHHFVGGNTLMQSVIKAHGDELGVTALDEQFDSTYVRTTRQLIDNAVVLSGSGRLVNDTLHVYCDVENRTGHKLPSGFPSRRMWLHLTVRDKDRNVIFESGAIDNNSEIIGLDDPYEPHQTIITDQGQVQIYESVMGDVNGNATVELLRAARYLKDNRIPPLGFAVASMDDDTVGVVGRARDDADFCRHGTTEGTGKDITEYRVKVDPTGYPFSISAELVYQSIKPEFIRNLARHQDVKTERMIRYWEGAPSRETVIARQEWVSTITGVHEFQLPTLMGIGAPYPSPLHAGSQRFVSLPLTLRRPASVIISIVDVLGRLHGLVDLGMMPSGRSAPGLHIGTLQPGMYFFRVRVEDMEKVSTLIIAG